MIKSLCNLSSTHIKTSINIFCVDTLHIICLVDQLFLTLCDFMDFSLPGSSVHGVFQARILEWIAVSSSRESPPAQGLNSNLLYLLHRKQILYLLSHQGSPHIIYYMMYECLYIYKLRSYKLIYTDIYIKLKQ